MPPPHVIVICGSTATGKSRLALTLAQRLNTVILGADSRQVYRQFDIGTAKPSAADRSKIPHYLVDICEPTETLTLADYQQQAQALISKHSGPLILVGGTGLYIKAIVRGLKIPAVPPHPDLRAQLTELGQPFCYQLLNQLDPTAARKIHPSDTVRTLRALEVFYVTGCPISSLQGENPPPYSIVQIGIQADPEILEQWIQHRTQTMIDQGLVSEVEQIMRQYWAELPLLSTLGYAEIRDYLLGKQSLATAQQAICLHTRQFAKRQRTWFRRQPDIHWLDVNAPDLEAQAWRLIH